MSVIDEEGNLFGVVNVVDALVVVALVAVLLGGIVLLEPLADTEEETRYATVDLGEQPPHIAEQISAGDVMAPDGTDNNVTVTDVYAGPGEEGNVTVSVRAEIEGHLIETDRRNGDVFGFDGEPIRQGDDLTIETSQYELDGSVTSLDSSGEELDVTETEVVVSTEVPAEVADQLEPGESYTLAGHEVATIETVSVHADDDPATKRAFVGITLQTIDDDRTNWFGDTEIRSNKWLSFETPGYEFSGQITEVGSLEPRGEVRTVSTVIKLENATPQTSDAVDVGMTDWNGDATILDERTEPTVVILESEDGDIHQHEHPRNEDVYLTVELTVYETENGLYYQGDPLREGSEIGFDFRTITVEATLIEIQEP